MDASIAKELEVFCDIEYARGHAVLSIEEMKRRVADKDILITSYDPVSREVIDAAPNLGLIVCTRANPVNVDTRYAAERGIKVSYAVERNSDSAAEFTVGLMLNVARNISFAFRDLHDGRFVAEALSVQKSESVERDVTWSTGDESPYVTYKGFELKGRTVGIVGCGSIGNRVADLCHAFGCEVIGCSESKTKDMVPGYMTLVSRQELASRSDIVTVHLKQGPASEQAIDEDFLGRMKPTAIFINTSRGSVVDEQALIRALEERKIAGAGLDVFTEEPIASDHPFLQMADRVLITPHIGGATWDAIANHTRQFVTDVKHFLAGEPLEYEYTAWL